jgi:hypothetical protein
MLDPNHDYQNLFAKYEVKYSLYDKIIMGLVFLIIFICLGFMLYGVFHPLYLLCH